MVRSVTPFFHNENGKFIFTKLAYKCIKTSVWIELRGICSDVLKSLTYLQSAIVIYML